MKWDLDTKIPFGKYRGFDIEDVINSDPSYIDWMIRTFPQSENTFSVEVTEALWKVSNKYS